MEQDSKITWESPVESAEQMLSEHTAQNKWIAELRKQLAERREVMREMIGRMNDEEVLELADMCLDELEHRDYSMLVVCANVDKEGSPFINKVVGCLLPIVSSLMSLCFKRKEFAKGLLVVAREYEARREEFAEEEE